MSGVSDEADEAAGELDSAGDSARDASDDFDMIGNKGVAALGALTTAISGAVTGLSALVAKTTKYAQTVDRAAAQSGIGAERIQEIAFAAQQVAGTEFEEVRDGLKELALRSQEAANGTGEAVETFDQLGISQQFLKENSTSEIFSRVRQELQGASSQMKIFAAETLLGGEAGQKMVEVLGLSNEEMSRLQTRAQETGKVLTGSQLAALEKTRRAWTSLTSEVVGTGRQLGAQLAPIVTSQVIPGLRSMAASVRSAVQAVTSMSDTTKGLVAVVGGLTAAVSSGLAVWSAWPAIVGAVTAAFSGLGTAATTAWAAITSPITGVIAAVAAVAGAAGLIYDNWNALASFGGDILSALGDVVAYYAARIERFFASMWADVKQLFVRGLNGLIDTINAGLEAIGAEDMTLSNIGVPESAVEENSARMKRLRKNMEQSTARANKAVQGSMGEAWEGVKKSTSDALSFLQGELAGIGSIFSFGSSGGGASSSSGGGAPQSGGGAPQSGGSSGGGGQGATLDYMIESVRRARSSLGKAKQEVTLWKSASKDATSAVARGFNRVASGLGSTLSNLLAGKNAAQSFGRTMVQALQGVLDQLLALIPKLAIIKSIGAIAGISTGGITSIGGALTAAIPGLAEGGIVTDSTLAMVGEGSESEAVMPLSKLEGMIGGSAQARGGTVRSNGRAALSQGRIEIPVEVVDRAGRQGARNSKRTARR